MNLVLSTVHQNVLEGEWVHLLDADGKPLEGIFGRQGACGPAADGEMIGIDLIRMAPGSSFPIHTHPGNHVLFVISGSGVARVKDEESILKQGDTFFIPAQDPHGVSNPGAQPLILLSVGHPHKRLDSKKRMQHPT